MSFPNLGLNAAFTPQEIRRAIISQRLLDNGNANQIALADTISLTTIQTYINYPDFHDNADAKWIPTALFYNNVQTLGDDDVYDEHGYYRKLKDGTYEIAWEYKDATPYYVKKTKALLESYGGNAQIMFITAGNRLLCVQDGAYLKGLRVQNAKVQNYTPPGASVAISVVVVRLETGSENNQLVSIEITGSADVTDDADFYSLIDINTAVSSDAVTGCTFTFSRPYDERSALTPNTDIVLTGFTYDMFNFVSRTDDDEETLAGAGSLTDNADGTVDINEAALLTAGETYDYEISFPKYNILQDDQIDVPS